MKMIRQGDVLLRKIETIPTNARQINASKDIRKDGIVLAYGEVTGHAHVVVMDRKAATPKAQLWSAGAERFIRVVEETALKHEEHSPIALEPGDYQVVQQREYSQQQAPRFVAD